MVGTNTYVQADNLLKIEAPNIVSRIDEQEGRSLPYPDYNVNSVVSAVNPVFKSFLILVDALRSSTKSVQPQFGYIQDYNRTFVLRTFDDNELWIQTKSVQFLSLLRIEDVESGISSSSEKFIKKALDENRILTLHMINQIYNDNVGNAHIQIGILHLSSHIDYIIASPNLQTIALAALNDKNDDVKDYAVQCFENWNHKDGLRILKTIHSDTAWLQHYIDSVIAALSANFPEVIST